MTLRYGVIQRSEASNKWQTNEERNQQRGEKSGLAFRCGDPFLDLCLWKHK